MTYEALTKAGVPLFAYGNFITVAINFLILAFIIFMMVKQINRLKRETPPAPPAAPPEEDRAAAGDPRLGQALDARLLPRPGLPRPAASMRRGESKGELGNEAHHFVAIAAAAAVALRWASPGGAWPTSTSASRVGDRPGRVAGHPGKEHDRAASHVDRRGEGRLDRPRRRLRHDQAPSPTRAS